MILKVIIDNPSSQVDQEFDYNYISDANNADGLIGCLVKVPFGESNRATQGIITGISEESAYLKNQGKLKDIIEIIDDEPILSKEDIELARYIKTQAICPMSRIFNMMIPHALRLKETKYLNILDSTNLDANLLMMFNGKLTVPYTVRFNKYKDIIKKAINNNYLEIVYDLNPKKINKYEKYVELIDYQYIPKTSKQEMIIEYLKNRGEQVSEKELMLDFGYITAALKRLKEANVVKATLIKATNIKERTINRKLDTVFNLDDNKEFNVDYLLNYHIKLFMLEAKGQEQSLICHLVKQLSELNKRLLIVVPDILKGYEVTNFLNKYFDLSIGNINATMSEAEIGELYLNLKKHQYQVFISTPAFAFYDYLSFDTYLVLDEDSSNYSLDQSPRLDVRKILERIALKYQKRLIYASFSPSIDSYVKALKNKYELIYLSSNQNNNIEVIDMHQALKNLESPIISEKLKRAIDDTLSKKQKVLLVLDNRSYCKSVRCKSCNSIIKCDKCHVSMQLNREKNILKCPICSSSIIYDGKCPHCGSTSLQLYGVGMQQVEEYLKKQNYLVKTLDNPSFSDFEDTIEAIEEEQIDIIISSKTYYKSIDVNNIGLIAFLDFDAFLNNYSFNATSSSHGILRYSNSLINNQKIMIQTYQKNHFVLKAFITNDYLSFFDEEIENRKLLKVEPFYQVNQILIKADYQEMFKIAMSIKKTINSLIKNVIIIGPSYNYQEKKVQLIIKHQNPDINNVYLRIYEMYQKSRTLIIFDLVSKNFG